MSFLRSMLNVLSLPTERLPLPRPAPGLEVISSVCFINFYWSMVALQRCVSFCCAAR